MKTRLAIGYLLLLVSITIASCDKGKNTYEEAEALFNKLDYSAAKTKAQEVIKNSPKSKYVAKANELIEKINFKEAEMLFNKSNYADAKSKAAELIQNIPNSRYIPQANMIIEKIDKMVELFNQAEQSLQEKDYKKAIMNYEEILAIDAKSPAAIEKLGLTKDTYKHHLLQTGNSHLEKGNYEEAIERYKEILSFEPSNEKIIETLNKAEKTLSSLKSLGDDAMYYFRIYIHGRGTRNFERAEVARVKYIGYIEDLYKFEGGREYLASKLRAYSVEVESSLDNLAKIVDEFEKAITSKNYNMKVLANDMYNNALIDFTSKYGQPEAWLDPFCKENNPAKLLRKCKTKELIEKKVEQWM